MKKIMFTVATMCFALATSFILLELVLRIIGYGPTYINALDGFYVGDSHLGWTGTPSFTGRFYRKNDFDIIISMDENGFRKIHSAVKPNSNAKNLVFIGDSFTWGYGVAQGEVFTDRLQDSLGVGFKIINLGVNGYGTVQEKLLLEQQIPNLKPLAVGLMLCHNDFDDNLDGDQLRRPYCDVEGGKVILKNCPVQRRIGGFYSKAIRKSYAASFIAYWFETIKAIVQYKLTGGGEGPDLEAVPPEKVIVMEECLNDIKGICESHGSRFFVFYIPRGGKLKSGTDIYLIELKGICSKLGIQLLDPYEYMRAAEPVLGQNGEPVHFRHDGHWTSEGHKLAAGFIMDYLFSMYPQLITLGLNR